jgi:hypothetical protein
MDLLRAVVYITNSVQTNPLKTNSHAGTQEFPSALSKPRVHYRVKKSPRLAATLSQINPVHTTPFYIYKIHFNIIFIPWLGVLVIYFLRLFHPNPVCIPRSSLACYMSYPSYPPWLDYSKYIWGGKWIMKLIITQFSLASYYFLHLGSKCCPQTVCILEVHLPIESSCTYQIHGGLKSKIGTPSVSDGTIYMPTRCSRVTLNTSSY